MFRRPRRFDFLAARLPAFPPGCLLVGGAARDALRGVTPTDFDWIAPDPEASARDLAARLGGSAFPLDGERGYWRVSAGEAQHDFVPLPASVEEDLRRRDFTVNAIALREDGTALDPLDGRADLRRRLLRAVSEDNLRDDPLRLLRAARFEVTLGFRLERGTEALVRRLAGAGLPWPAPERVREELVKMLGSPDAARGVARLEELGLLALYLPELREGLGLEQGGFHHLDVFRHNVEALHQLLARFPDAPLPLRLAALLHDVGKPRARGTDGTSGRTTFHGHDKIGAAMTSSILTRLRFPTADAERAAALVRAHMVPLPANEREARRFVHRRRDLLPDLLKLMLADREAARGPDSSPATRLWYGRAMDRVLAALEEQPARPAPLLRGEEVMALLGTGPGPRVGEVLRALEEARAVGDVTTPDEARDFVRHFAPDHRPDI